MMATNREFIVRFVDIETADATRAVAEVRRALREVGQRLIEHNNRLSVSADADNPLVYRVSGPVEGAPSVTDSTGKAIGGGVGNGPKH